MIDEDTEKIYVRKNLSDCDSMFNHKKINKNVQLGTDNC